MLKRIFSEVENDDDDVIGDNALNMDTMLDKPDYIEASLYEMTFAPVEGQLPLSTFQVTMLFQQFLW